MLQTKWDKRAVTKTEQGCRWLQEWRSSWLCSSLNKHIGEAGAWNRSQWYFGKLRGEIMYGLSGTMRMLPRLKNIFRHRLVPKLGKFPWLRIYYSMGLYTKILWQRFLCYNTAVLQTDYVTNIKCDQCIWLLNHSEWQLHLTHPLNHKLCPGLKVKEII